MCRIVSRFEMLAGSAIDVRSAGERRTMPVARHRHAAPVPVALPFTSPGMIGDLVVANGGRQNARPPQMPSVTDRRVRAIPDRANVA